MKPSEAETGSPSILDFQAIGRVIDLVREADAGLGAAYELPATDDPADWDRVRNARTGLASAISWAYTLRDVHADWTSDSRAKRRYEALGRVHRMSRELLALIGDDQLPLSSSLASRFAATDENGFHVVDFSQLMVGLERLRDAAEWERIYLRSNDLNETAPLSHIEDDSASFATPGNSFMSGMAKAFEKGFGCSPSIKFTTEREPTGPFVRFVEAVTREMGDPMSPDGIRRAWDRAKTIRTRTEKSLKLVP
jgi:hypothetical protein